MTTLTEYESLTERALALTPEQRAEQIAYWHDCHEEENEDLLTDDLMCQCCGVDYSGYDRDTLGDLEVDNRPKTG